MKLFILLICLSISNEILGQEYYFKHYQVEQGLSNNTVLCAAQDRKGFLWFGTRDGLNRFDGYSFKVFRNNPNDSNSLPTNSIRSLYEDRNGQMWVGTEKGLRRYNEKLEQFEPVPGGLPKEIRCIEMDLSGELWFVSDFRLYRFRPGSPAVSIIPPINGVTALYIDNGYQIWIGTIHGTIAKFDPVHKTFQEFNLFRHSRPVASFEINCITRTADGAMLIGTSGQGVKRFDPASGTYEDILTYRENGTEIFARNFLTRSPREIWIATESGIYIYDIADKQFRNLKKNYYDPYSLTDNAIYTLCRDMEGGIWVGSYFGGVSYFADRHFIIRKYFPQQAGHSVNGNAIREMAEDRNGNLWIGSEDAGLNKFNPKSGIFTSFKPGNSGNGISHTNIHGLLIDNDKLWIGTFEHGLDVMDLKSEKIIKHYGAGDLPGQLKSNFIYTFYKTRDGTIIVGTSNGLYLYDRTQDSFHLIRSLPFNTFYSAITEDHTGTIWVGTFTSGVYFFNRRNGVVGKLNIHSSHYDRLVQNRILYIKEDSGQNIWIATEAGLFALSTDRKKCTAYSEASGLPSNLVYTVIEDNDRNLWFSTSKGLVRMDRQSKNLQVFSKSDGLLNEQFNYNSAFKYSNGDLYFGSVKGMISFTPGNFIRSHYHPPLYITGFQMFNKEVNFREKGSPFGQSILLTNEIRLKHNQSTFSIDFAALTFTAPENVKYAYKLKGLDTGWNAIRTNRRIYFTDLAPGNYTLNVKSTNSSGIWMDNERTLTLTILPPWWKTKWAYVIYVVIFAGLTYLIIAFINRHHAEKQQRQMELFEMNKEKEFHKSRINFFTRVAHEIRTPLTLIKAPMEKIIRQIDQTPHLEKYLLLMNKYTDRLLELTDQLLDFRKVESENYTLNLTSTNMSEIIEEIVSNFRQMAESQGFKMRLLITGRAASALVDRDAITKLIGNLIQNAIKYGKSFIQIELISPYPEGGNIMVKVSNDGELIPPELSEKIFDPFYRAKNTGKIRGTGIGLTLARSLAELHKGRLYLDTSGKMNTFVLLLPSEQKREIVEPSTQTQF